MHSRIPNSGPGRAVADRNRPLGSLRTRSKCEKTWSFRMGVFQTPEYTHVLFSALERKIGDMYKPRRSEESRKVKTLYTLRRICISLIQHSSPQRTMNVARLIFGRFHVLPRSFTRTCSSCRRLSRDTENILTVYIRFQKKCPMKCGYGRKHWSRSKNLYPHPDATRFSHRNPATQHTKVATHFRGMLIARSRLGRGYEYFARVFQETTTHVCVVKEVLI
jgi:hypothetical protein